MQVIKANGESSFIEYAIAQYGNIEAAFDMAFSNGLSVDSVPVLNSNVSVPVLEIRKKQTIFNRSLKPVSKYVKAGGDQALIDLAIQEAGTVEGLFEVAFLNGLSITDDLIPGNEYLKPSVQVQKIVDLFANTHKPASNAYNDLTEQPEGIDYWYIENNFIVN